jgi:hypothetical protein
VLVAVPDISTSLSDDGGVVGVEGLHQQPFEQGGYVPKHPLLGLIGDAESGWRVAPVGTGGPLTGYSDSG